MDGGHVTDGQVPAGETTRSATAPWYRRSGVRWLVAAVTFVVGLFVGGVIVGFASSPAEPVVARSTVTMTPSAPMSPPASVGTDNAVTGQAALNAACLQAINDAQSTYAVLGQLLGAVKGFDLGKLDALVRRLQPMQAELRQDFDACHVTARLSTPSPSPSG
jgi:hypothetical protein